MSSVLIFDGMEVLDFASPFEVFGVARDAQGAFGFEVFNRDVLARCVTAVQKAKGAKPCLISVDSLNAS